MILSAARRRHCWFASLGLVGCCLLAGCGGGEKQPAVAESDAEKSAERGQSASKQQANPEADATNPPPVEPETRVDPDPGEFPIDIPEESEDVDPAEPVIEPMEPAPSPQPTKTPVPGKAARDASRKAVLELFPVDQARSPEEKAKLAGTLLTTARGTSDDPTARFVLLNLARELAAGAADIDTAYAAIELLEAEYDFDVGPVRLATLGAALKAPVSPQDKEGVVLVGIYLIQQRLAADDYDGAQQMVQPLLDIARRARNTETSKTLIELRKRARDQGAVYAKVKPALGTLKSNPDDPAANLTAGKYYLISKGDWAKALPLLAKGSDQQLAMAALAEAKQPESPQDIESLASMWWAVAESEREKAASDLYRARSGMWYGEVINDLSGLAKVRAEQRLAAAPVWEANEDSNLAILDPGGQRIEEIQRIPDNLLELVDPAEASQGSWSKVDSGLRAPNGGFMTIPLQVDAASYELAVRFTRQGGLNFAFILPVHDRYVTAFLGVRTGNEPHIGGFADIAGKNLWKSPARGNHPNLEQGRPHDVHISVHTERGMAALQLAVDGRSVATWRGSINDLSVGRVTQSSQPVAPDKARHIAFTSEGGDMTYHAAAIRVRAGAAHATGAPPPSEDETGEPHEPDLGVFSRDPSDLRPGDNLDDVLQPDGESDD